MITCFNPILLDQFHRQKHHVRIANIMYGNIKCRHVSFQNSFLLFLNHVNILVIAELKKKKKTPKKPPKLPTSWLHLISINIVMYQNLYGADSWTPIMKIRNSYLIHCPLWCYWPGEGRGYGTCNHGTDLDNLVSSGPSTRRVNSLRPSDAYMRQ